MSPKFKKHKHIICRGIEDRDSHDWLLHKALYRFANPWQSSLFCGPRWFPRSLWFHFGMMKQHGWLSVIICHLISLNTASKQPNAQGTWCSHPVSRGLSARTPPSALNKRLSKLWPTNQGSMFWPRKCDKGSSKFYRNLGVFAACSNADNKSAELPSKTISQNEPVESKHHMSPSCKIQKRGVPLG